MKRRLLCLLLLTCLPWASGAQPAAAPATAPAPAAAAAGSAGAAAPADAQTRQVFPTTPVAKPGGGKWRIGYFESGDYSEYPRTLRVIVNGLKQLGWLEVPELPASADGRELWRFLAQNVRSDYLQFVEDAWWQPGNFDAAMRPQVRESLSRRLSEKHDIDLLLALGTWAGQDSRAIGAPVPTMVASVSDAVGSGIVASALDSGLDNLHARVEPERYQRQVRLFRDIVPFQRLGIVFEDSKEGRTYAAVGAVHQVAGELGFQVEECHAQSNSIPIEQATQNAVQCYADLAQRVDAIYVTVHRGVTEKSVPEIAHILREAKIPSFSMGGSQEVQAGVLMSLAQADYSYVGLFHAESIARVLNGAKPRQLTQVWIDPAKIALNLETARIIGFDPPVDILLAADEVYEGK